MKNNEQVVQLQLEKNRIQARTARGGLISEKAFCSQVDSPP